MQGGSFRFKGRSKSKLDYGVVSLASGDIAAHRLSWKTFIGPIPDGKRVCHSCDNPPCVNPDHLFIGTALDNNRDAWEKGRRCWGEDHPKAKLTTKAVLEIRRIFKPWDKERGVRPLAKRFGCSESIVAAVVKRRRWKHIE